MSKVSISVCWLYLQRYAHISEPFVLSNFTVHSCILHSGSSDIIYCEQLPHVHSKHSFQIVARKLNSTENRSLSLADSRVILTHVPPLQFLSFEDGVCFIPADVPYPNGLLLFWAYDEASKLDILKPFIWNCTSMLDVYDLNPCCDPLSFATLTKKLTYVYNKVCVIYSD